MNILCYIFERHKYGNRVALITCQFLRSIWKIVQIQFRFTNWVTVFELFLFCFHDTWGWSVICAGSVNSTSGPRGVAEEQLTPAQSSRHTRILLLGNMPPGVTSLSPSVLSDPIVASQSATQPTLLFLLMTNQTLQWLRLYLRPTQFLVEKSIICDCSTVRNSQYCVCGWWQYFSAFNPLANCLKKKSQLKFIIDLFLPMAHGHKNTEKSIVQLNKNHINEAVFGFGVSFTKLIQQAYNLYCW